MAERKKSGPAGRGGAQRKPAAKRGTEARGPAKRGTEKRGPAKPARKPAVRTPRTAEPDAPNEDGLVRLNKYLADHGVASRRACDELIAAGKVTVDGEPVTQLGTRIDPSSQRVEVGGDVLKPDRLRLRYFLLNKPPGVVCTNERRESRPRAIDLISDPKAGRIYTVGRLDEDSSGLILLTNDGEWANRIMHPRYQIEKSYRVKVRGKIDDEALEKVRSGVHLSEGKTGGARVLIKKRDTDYSHLIVNLTEGMNREIRRAFARIGFKVVDLERVRIGPLTLAGIKRPGRWRELTMKEAQAVLDPEAAPPPRKSNRSTKATRSGGAPRRPRKT